MANKKLIGLVLVLVTAGLLGAYSFFGPSSKVLNQPKTIEEKSTQSLVEVTARFEIYTLGTKRVFTNTMYHNLSDDVFITSNDPQEIHVTKKGITWADFFNTLPFELSYDCLLTGTGQKFCTNSQNSLNFYLNGVKTGNLLEREISSGDSAVIRYE